MILNRRRFLTIFLCGLLLKDALGTCYNGRCRRRCRRHNYYPNGNCGELARKISHPMPHKFHSSYGWSNGNPKPYLTNAGFNGNHKHYPGNPRPNGNHNLYPASPRQNGQPKYYSNTPSFNGNQAFNLDTVKQKNIEVIHHYIILAGFGNNGDCVGPICPDLTQPESSRTSLVTEQSQSSESRSSESSASSMSMSMEVSGTSQAMSSVSEASTTLEPEVATPPPEGMSREDSYKAEFESSFSSSNSSKVEGQSSSDSSPANSNTRYKAEFESNYSNSSSSKVESRSSENKGEEETSTEAPTTEETATEASLESASIDELLRVLTSKLGVLSSSSSSASSSSAGSSSESASEQSRRRRDSISSRQASSSNLRESNYEIILGDASEVNAQRLGSDGVKANAVFHQGNTSVILLTLLTGDHRRRLVLPDHNAWSYIPQLYNYTNGESGRVDYGNDRQVGLEGSSSRNGQGYESVRHNGNDQKEAYGSLTKERYYESHFRKANHLGKTPHNPQGKDYSENSNGYH